jgi:hypothetical protein
MPAEQSRAAGWRSMVLLCAAVAALAVACNAAVGAGAVALMGGAGFVAAQCYDRVRLRVRDATTGMYTCEADVAISESGESERLLRPCYSAALTAGKYRITARRPGYVPASTELVIAERDGDCPHYTRSIELTLRSENDPARLTQVTPKAKPAPPPVPAAPEAPPASPESAVPTRSFELLPPADAGAVPASP